MELSDDEAIASLSLLAWVVTLWVGCCGSVALCRLLYCGSVWLLWVDCCELLWVGCCMLDAVGWSLCWGSMALVQSTWISRYGSVAAAVSPFFESVVGVNMNKAWEKKILEGGSLGLAHAQASTSCRSDWAVNIPSQVANSLHLRSKLAVKLIGPADSYSRRHIVKNWSEAKMVKMWIVHCYLLGRGKGVVSAGVWWQ